MISRKIDLTENQDFSRVHFDIPRIRRLDQEDIDLLFEPVSEFEKFIKHENFFGRRTHKNQKESVFNYEQKHKEEWRTKCARCGERIIPWDDYGNICHKCDIELEPHEVPWKKYYIPTENHSFSDLFDLR